MKNDVSKKAKSSREKRVLIGSLCIAAAVMAGSTFAWFSSKDEVTNRLSAKADYDVTIAEDFTPPENWIPGQKIDKNVGFVNTGNVDAFVRSYLQGEMRVLNETSSAVETWNTTDKKFTDLAAGVITSGLTAVTDTTLTDLNLNYSLTNGGKTYYLRELSKTKRDNPDPANPDDANPDAYSEVMSVQAGGELVYTNGTKFIYKPNQSDTVHDAANSVQNIVGGKTYTVTIGTNANNITVDNTANTILVSDIKYLPSVDSDEFKPATTGLYVFRRNADLNTDLSADDMEFSGYYYVATAAAGDAAASEGTGVYLKLHNGVASPDTDRSDYTLPKDAITSTYASASNTWTYAPTAALQLYTAERTTVENSDLTWTYVAPAAGTQGRLEAKYNDIKINVYLANILGTTQILSDSTATKDTGLEWATASTDAESWTPVFTGGVAPATPVTFYYNNDLEEGCTTERLVDSVELDSSVTQDDYLTFDFDLNVFMESVQVTIGEDGAEGDDSVKPWNGTAGGAVAAAGTKTMDTANTNEIASIAWAYSAP
jgi:predicted ribosomally synthesized peptide with SipW-like signal peptide